MTPTAVLLDKSIELVTNRATIKAQAHEILLLRAQVRILEARLLREVTPRVSA